MIITEKKEEVDMLVLEEIKIFFDDLGDLAKKKIKTYFIWFISILTILFLSSIILTTIGIVWESRWVIAIGGIIRLVGTIFLFTAIAPIIVPVGALAEDNPLSKFVNRAKGFCYAELLMTLALLILLPWLPANAAFMPIFIILALAFYAGGGVVNKKIITPILVMILLLAITSLFMPSRFEHYSQKVKDFDREVAMIRLQPTLEEINSGKFSFVDSRTGEIICFYVFNPRSRDLELYRYPGVHPSLLERARPVDESVIEIYLEKQALREKEKKKAASNKSSSSLAEKEKLAYQIETVKPVSKTSSVKVMVPAKKQYKVALAIFENDRKIIVDAKPLMSKFRQNKISAINLAGNYYSLSGLAKGGSKNFPRNSEAKYILVGTVDNSAYPNNLYQQGSSYSSDSEIKYCLFSSSGRIIDQSSVKGGASAFGVEEAKELSTRIALGKLGDKIYSKIQ